MLKYVVAFAVVVGAGFYLLEDTSAMQKCQEKYSYSTCRMILR